MSDIPDHVAVLIIHAATQQDLSGRIFVDSFEQKFAQTYQINFSKELIDTAFSKLLAAGGARRLPSSLAGDLIELRPDHVLRFFGERAKAPSASTSVEYDQGFKAAHTHLPVFQAYAYGGKEWVDRVIARFQSGEIEGVTPNGVARFDVPAADRIVSLDHNSAPLQEVREATNNLTQQLRQGNDVGNLSADMVKVALHEVEQISTALHGDALRVSAFMERARSTLTWIGKEAAGALVGASALTLLALLASYFGSMF